MKRPDERHSNILMAGLMLSGMNNISARPEHKVQTRNLSPEEIAERDRPISRQERRQMERLRKKGRKQ